MHTPSEPIVSTAAGREAMPEWASLDNQARGVAPLSLDAPAVVDHKIRARADLPAALSVVKHTVSLGALASGLIEYMGWQIANRGTDSVVPWGKWALGALGSLGGAIAIGIGLAMIAMVLALPNKRPLRAGAATFAFGVAGFLGFLAFLVSRAF